MVYKIPLHLRDQVPLLGDLTAYAEWAMSISPIEATDFAITIIKMDITAQNIIERLPSSGWVGGEVLGVQPFYFKGAVPQPPNPIVFDFEDQPDDTSPDGTLTSLAMTRSGLTLELGRSSGLGFDVHTRAGYPNEWGG